MDSILEEEDEVEEEDLSQTQKLERSGHGQESDSRSALSVQEEESSQDTNHTQPRRSSRAHKQTQRFAEMDDHDDETMAAPAAYERATAHQNHAMVQISTRRSSRRIENGTTDKDFSKVDSLSLKRKADSVPRERITMKVNWRMHVSLACTHVISICNPNCRRDQVQFSLTLNFF